MQKERKLTKIKKKSLKSHNNNNINNNDNNKDTGAEAPFSNLGNIYVICVYIYLYSLIELNISPNKERNTIEKKEDPILRQNSKGEHNTPQNRWFQGWSKY